MVDFGFDALRLAGDLVAEVVPLQAQGSEVEHSSTPAQDCQEPVDKDDEVECDLY